LLGDKRLRVTVLEPLLILPASDRPRFFGRPKSAHTINLWRDRGVMLLQCHPEWSKPRDQVGAPGLDRY